MIKIINDADKKVKDLIYNDNVISFYKSVCELYTKDYVNVFINQMQILVTKLGIIISKIDFKHPQIKYCSSSLRYLCCDVLDNENLFKTFKDIGLNDKGNAGKHSIVNNQNIDIQRCVSSFNNLVNRIADMYGLRSLKKIIVRKNVSSNNNNSIANSYHKQNNNSKQGKIFNSKKLGGRPDETTALVDENLKLKATLKKGAGRYEKGILMFKKGMVNFILDIKITNMKDLKISRVDAIITGKNGVKTQKKISPELKSVTEFDLPTSDYGGNIEASVIVKYKIGVFKSKEIKVTVSKKF